MKTALVARSTFGSQNELKCTKHTRVGPLFEVEMSKKCTPLWPGMGEEQHTEKEDPEVLCSATSSGDEIGSDAASDLNEEVFHQENESMLKSGIGKVAPGDLMQNQKKRMLHKRSNDEKNHLQPITVRGVYGSGFVWLPNGASFNWPKCSKCFQVSAKEADLSEASSVGKRRKMV